MNRPVPFLLFSGLLLLFSVFTAALLLPVAWQTDTVFRVPKSVLTAPSRKVCYVSTIDRGPGEKGGMGFISKMSPKSKILTSQRVTGLVPPNGMGLVGAHRYVADLFQSVATDMTSGNGHVIQDSNSILYLESLLFQRVSGLLAHPAGIYVADVEHALKAAVRSDIFRQPYHDLYVSKMILYL